MNTRFPSQANGTLVTDRSGNVVGSALLAQSFSQPQYFHPRPSAAGTDGYGATASGGSNLGPTNQKLIDTIQQRADAYRQENGLAPDAQVPVDAVTASASGLDPDISPANALLQASRVAAARGRRARSFAGPGPRHGGRVHRGPHAVCPGRAARERPEAEHGPRQSLDFQGAWHATTGVQPRRRCSNASAGRPAPGARPPPHYLCIAPGVGKTYTALEELHRRQNRGTDAVIGFLETHGRPRTAVSPRVWRPCLANESRTRASSSRRWRPTQ